MSNYSSHIHYLGIHPSPIPPQRMLLLASAANIRSRLLSVSVAFKVTRFCHSLRSASRFVLLQLSNLGHTNCANNLFGSWPFIMGNTSHNLPTPTLRSHESRATILHRPLLLRDICFGYPCALPAAQQWADSNFGSWFFSTVSDIRSKSVSRSVSLSISALERHGPRRHLSETLWANYTSMSLSLSIRSSQLVLAECGRMGR